MAVAALRVLGVEAGAATWTSDAVAALGVLGVVAGAAQEDKAPTTP